MAMAIYAMASLMAQKTDQSIMVSSHRMVAHQLPCFCKLEHFEHEALRSMATLKSLGIWAVGMGSSAFLCDAVLHWCTATTWLATTRLRLLEMQFLEHASLLESNPIVIPRHVYRVEYSLVLHCNCN